MAGVVLLAAVLAGCSGKPDGCTPVGEDVARAIAAEADPAVRLSADGQAIRADSGVYYVAVYAFIDGDRSTGVWALDGIDPPGDVRAASNIAQEFTSWPVLPGAAGTDMVRDAAACLDG